MDPQAVSQFINSIAGSIGSALTDVIQGLGFDVSKVTGIINLIGLFTAGLITVLIVTAGIISYVKGSQYEPFNSSYEDDAFVRGRAGTVMGILTIVCAVWFLFAIVYIYFVG